MKNVVVRNTSQIPIYQQLYDQLSSQIINGDLKADDLLPSIRTTAKELRVSVITIKKTWELLESNGFIYTIKGKGSYVKGNTEVSLRLKKVEAIENLLSDVLVTCREYDLTTKELLDIVEKLYNNMK